MRTMLLKAVLLPGILFLSGLLLWGCSSTSVETPAQSTKLPPVQEMVERTPTTQVFTLATSSLMPTASSTASPESTPTRTLVPTQTQIPYCERLSQTYHAPVGFTTYCDDDYGFAFDYPIGWEIKPLLEVGGAPASHRWILRSQMFHNDDMTNYIRVDTSRLYNNMSLLERVRSNWSYEERDIDNVAYPQFKIGGRQAYAVVNRWVQDYSGVTLFFQHDQYYTQLELKVMGHFELDTNWNIARTLQFPGTSPNDNHFPEALIENGYMLLTPHPEQE